MKRFILIFIPMILALVSFKAQAQSTQTVKGTVFDAASEIELIGATVEIVTTDPSLGTTTEYDGSFSIPEVPLGRHTIVVSYLGYESITVPNVVVTAGKEVILELTLEESVEQLNEVVVTAESDKDRAQNELATISARTFSMEEVNRYSGGRSDVGRLAANFAGVSTADDARNDIVIRGNSPTGVLWRLEGVPIPSPNHFSTLGTTGGPVSALNPNLLKNSDFMTSAFPAEYGNATAGVFDLGLRSGNKDNHEFMFQFGAVSGLEAMAEGPMGKDNGSSYLVSARYGFVGLAGDIGLPIGTNATPNYQDLAFKLDFGKTKAGKFSLFGIGGRSDIDFLHDEIDENDLFAANDEDSFARSGFGVLGLRHNILLDDKTYVRTVLAGSLSTNEFWVDRYTDLDQPTETVNRITEFDNAEYRVTLSSYINRKFNSRFTARAGIISETYIYDLSAQTREFTPDWYNIYNFDENTNLFQAYVQGKYKITEDLSFNAGVHTQFLSLNNDFVIEPRAALNYDITDNHMVSLGYGMHHQTIPMPILLTRKDAGDGNFIETNTDLDAMRSQHFVLGYDAKLGGEWRVKAEAYYQILDQVPVDSFASSFSLLNLGEDFGFPDDKYDLVNEGTGRNYGLEVTVEKFFSKGYYGLLTASIYDSTYKGSDDVRRNTAFNNGYVLNVLAGKEFPIGKEKRNALTFDTKLTTAGGRFYTPIDSEASAAAGQEIRQDDIAFSERQDGYFRWDVKFGIKLNSKKKKISHQFYFDIQNVTNRENIFTRRYNRLTNEVNEVYQNGFFPDFMYRIQF